MAKSRKGRKSLETVYKSRFERALTKYEETLLEEQALKEVLTGLTTSKKPATLFKHLDFDEIRTKGITRQVAGKTKKYKGFEAVGIQIKSLEQRANKDAQKDNFIQNYTKALQNEGYNKQEVARVREQLNELNHREISVVITENMLPSIYRIYGDKNKQDVLNEITDSIEAVQISGVGDNINAKVTALQKNIIERWRILE